MAGSLTDMISLRRARYDELEKFCAWDLQAHARRFVTGGSLEIHQRDFPKDNTHYLAIVDTAGEPIGYFLLRVESGEDTVEFHRIVIERGAIGVGQGHTSNAAVLPGRARRIKGLARCVRRQSAWHSHIREARVPVVQVGACWWPDAAFLSKVVVSPRFTVRTQLPT